MQEVFVYRNLHKNCLSVRDVKTRRVIAHVHGITLKDCKFKVSIPGRQRVLTEKRKNVHAGVQGIWVKEADAPSDLATRTRVVYNPYKHETFVVANTLAPKTESTEAFVTIEGAFVCT